MNLFGSQRTPIMFSKASLQRNRDGDRSATLLFKVKLNGQNVRSTPKFVKDCYALCKDGAQSEAQLDAAIDVQNVEMYSAPEIKKSSVKLTALTFDHLRIRKNKESDVYLYLQTSLALSANVGRFILDSYGTDLFAVFEDCQGKLKLDDAEEEETDDSQGELLEEDEEEDEDPEPNTEDDVELEEAEA